MSTPFTPLFAQNGGVPATVVINGVTYQFGVPLAPGNAALSVIIPVANPVTVTSPYSGDSLSVMAAVNGPAALAAIVTTGALGAGTWDVEVIAGYGAAAGVATDMRVQVGAAIVGGIYVNPVANGAGIPHRFRLTTPAATAITVNAIAGGAFDYQACIIWTPTR